MCVSAWKSVPQTTISYLYRASAPTRHAPQLRRCLANTDNRVNTCKQLETFSFSGEWPWGGNCRSIFRWYSPFIIVLRDYLNGALPHRSLISLATTVRDNGVHPRLHPCAPRKTKRYLSRAASMKERSRL